MRLLEVTAVQLGERDDDRADGGVKESGEGRAVEGVGPQDEDGTLHVEGEDEDFFFTASELSGGQRVEHGALLHVAAQGTRGQMGVTNYKQVINCGS